MIPPEIESRIHELKVIFDDVLKTISHDFFAQQKWGILNFVEISREYEERLKPTLNALMSIDLSFLNPAELDEIGNKFGAIQAATEEISTFNIDQGDATARRSQIISQLRAHIRKFEAHVATFAIPILLQILSSDERKAAVDSAREEAAKLIGDAEETLKSISRTEKSVSEILDNVRDAAANVGVEIHATIFETESQSLKRQSYWWLVATAVLLIASGFGAAYFYQNPSFALGDITIALQIIVPKVLLLGLLVSITVWCGRNYRALAHEAAVNKHRANALSTFRTFVDATKEPEVRNAVLLEATRAIFSQAPSGYLDKSDNSGSDNRITEVVRSFNSATRMTS